MILRELSEAVGVSGDEGDIRAAILSAVRGHVDETRVDPLGNLLALKRGTDEQPLRVMVDAHMDEVGLMVVGHEDEGYLKVRPIGTIDPRVLPGKQFQVGRDRLPGVIGIKPIHLIKKGEEVKVPELESLVLDIGAKSKDEGAKLAPVGTYATFVTEYRELGPTVSGKAFDDRAGCCVLVDLLQGDRFPCDLYAAFTVQEEVGLRGAQVAAHSVNPDCAFALEGTIADDLPKEKEGSPTTRVGDGPAITIMDRSFIADKRLVRLLTNTAEELGIPTQIKQPRIGSTDGGAIHKARGGIPTVTVSLPCRYSHSPAMLLNLEDYENTVKLMRAALTRISSDTLRRDE
jgi:putative aminopeptidase FrvX